MPEFPFTTGGLISNIGGGGSSTSTGTTLTAGSANTKGSAVELTGATPHDAAWVIVHLSNVNSNADYLVDVMIGAATEQVIIPDLYVSGRANGADFGPYIFPLFIPAGSRLSARCQASVGGATIAISITLIAPTATSGGAGPSIVSSYGATTNSLGTNIDPGATANTDSAWVEIAAATARTHTWLCMGVRFGDRVISAASAWRLSIGIGAAPEQVLIPNICASCDSTSDASYSPVICLPVFIPEGSRLSGRVRSSTTTDGDRDIWIRLYGV